MTDTNKMAEQFKNMMPQVNFNKNGYEIRTQILDMAKDSAWQDYYARWGQFETEVTKDEETGEAVTKVTMPEVPGVDTVLETAQKFYDFVNKTK